MKLDLNEDAGHPDKTLRLTNQWAAWPAHSSLSICKWEQTSSLSSGKGWAPDIDWVPVLICSDVRAHIYKGVASCHLLHSSSSFSTLPVACSYPSLVFTFKPLRCLLPLSSSSLLSDFLFQFYSPHTLNSLPIVRKVQRNLRPCPPPTVSHDSFITQASFTLSHS